MGFRSDTYFKKASIWIKENRQPLNVIGGLFFASSFVAGLVWISGKDVEPIAFVLCLLSSMFLAAPSIAEYFDPARKPVRHMSYEEILNFIITTDANDDWQGFSTSVSSECFLKEDPRLRLKALYTEDGTVNAEYSTEWTEKFPGNAYQAYRDLYYGDTHIERFILVYVDGSKAHLPQPDITTDKIEPLNYRIAEIFDRLNRLDEYIRRSGLKLSEVKKSSKRTS